MDEIDNILDSLDPSADRSGGSFSQRHILVAVVVLLLTSLIGAGVALSRQDAPQQEKDVASDNSELEHLWALLLSEAPGCAFSESQRQLVDTDTRTMAVFAAARYNCADLVKQLIARGINLDEKRFIKGEVLSLEDYAAQFGAIDTIKVIQEEQRRRSIEHARVKDENRETEQLLALQRQREVETLLAENVELQHSIFYERAKLDCEVLRERLGFGAVNFRMNDCIRQGIAKRRSVREELGHKVPD